MASPAVVMSLLIAVIAAAITLALIELHYYLRVVRKLLATMPKEHHANTWWRVWFAKGSLPHSKTLDKLYTQLRVWHAVILIQAIVLVVAIRFGLAYWSGLLIAMSIA